MPQPIHPIPASLHNFLTTLRSELKPQWEAEFSSSTYNFDPELAKIFTSIKDRAFNNFFSEVARTADSRFLADFRTEPDSVRNWIVREYRQEEQRLWRTKMEMQFEHIERMRGEMEAKIDDANRALLF